MTHPCNQKNCEKPGEFRYFWPGEDEKTICGEHAPKLVAIVEAMGFRLPLFPVVEREIKEALGDPEE